MPDDNEKNPKEEKLNTGAIIRVPIVDEMKKSYLDYAMSVIVARALPDVRDGLKPVHRRIIYAANELNVTSDSKLAKSARIVGEVMAKYHPHGDASIYDALVRMAQDFSLRYPLIEGQGNFGSIEGDPPAAMRYTECRLEKISDYLLKDIDKDTVEFIDNYSAEYIEPTVLPAVIPNLLINGSSGIAVGMATNIPPHNLNEVVDAIFAVLEEGKLIEIGHELRKIKAYDIIETEADINKWQIENTLTFEDIYKYIQGPDFPTGSTIYDKSETLNYFRTGKGKIVQRSTASIKEQKNGKSVIIITEIPYQINKSALIEKIAELVQTKRAKDISSITDMSSGEDIQIEIELKREGRPQKVLNYLYKYSPLQSAFSANMLALVEGEPRLLNIKEFLDEFIKHRREVITNRTLHLLKKAREREHILLGLKKALDFIDKVIELIKKSKDSEEAKIKLIKELDLTDIQAQAILDMQLRRLAALEREKIENELKEIQNSINGFLLILSKPKEMIKIIKSELKEIKDQFGDARKTKVIKGKIGEFNEEDLIANEKTLISVTASGYIKRMKPSTYKTQSRGGKGVVGMKTKEEDEVALLRIADTHDTILFLTDKGRIFEKRVWDIPEGSRTGKGTAMVNIIDAMSSEKVVEIIAIDKVTRENKDRLFLLTATRDGNIKKTELAHYENIRKTGIIAMGLKDEDKLVRAMLTTGTNDLIMVSEQGKSIRFKESDVRPMGRSASGVRGMKLSEGDKVVNMEVINSDNAQDQRLMVITKRGHGKCTRIEDYTVQNRGGSGIKASNITPKTGKIAAVRLLTQNITDVLLTSELGQIIRLQANSVPILGRATQGVILMRLNEGDEVSAISVFDEQESATDAEIEAANRENEQGLENKKDKTTTSTIIKEADLTIKNSQKIKPSKPQNN